MIGAHPCGGSATSAFNCVVTTMHASMYVLSCNSAWLTEASLKGVGTPDIRGAMLNGVAHVLAGDLLYAQKHDQNLIVSAQSSV